ncbi:MAG: alpha/beta fold hydrolase [Actinomycetota bacterium]|nr:alpha/beta fold hydrolase [Actinomycetota bacterium]
MERSDEQIARLPTGIELCYDTFGNPDRPALLLIMGLSGPMIWWHSAFCERLAERGFFVIRFDNRDIGRSTKISDKPVRRIDAVQALLRGPRGRPPYTLSDMAGDAVGLLDDLGVRRAHVTGVSMGGMIAQTMAIEHPSRVLSLVSMMSTTGRRVVGWQDPRVLPLLLRSRPPDKQAYVQQSLTVWRLIGSPGYATPPEAEQVLAEATYDRGLSPEGVLRQMHAILAQPDRSAALRTLDVPTLVIHGLSDKMVHVSGGRATAEAIPGAELLLIPGMGHNLPPEIWPAIIDGIERTARRATSR